MNDEIAPVKEKSPILDGPLRARSDADHFGDINEMVGDRVAAVGAGFPSLGEDGDEIAEVGVFQHSGQFSCGPKLRAGLVDAFDALEGVAGSGRG